MTVRFVDIGGNVDHHFLNFPFIEYTYLIVCHYCYLPLALGFILHTPVGPNPEYCPITNSIKYIGLPIRNCSTR